MKITPPEAGCKTFSGYYFKVPDELISRLSELSHAELKSYLVALHGIQKHKNAGELSIRQIASRANLSPQHTQPTMAKLTGAGFLGTKEGRGLRRTTIYTLPFEWRKGNDCSTAGEQSNLPVVQNCSTPGVQNCSTQGEQHLESLEKRKTSSFEAAAVKVEADRPTDDERSVSLSENTNTEWWTGSEEGYSNLDRAADLLRRARAECFEAQAGGLAKALRGVGRPDHRITREICELFSSFEDFEAWAENTVVRGVGRKAKEPGYGIYRRDATDNADNFRNVRQTEADAEAEERAERDRVRSSHEDQCAGYYLTKDEVPRFAKRDGKKYKHIPGRLCSCRKGQELGADGLAQKVREFIEKNADAAASNGYTLVTEAEWLEVNAAHCDKCLDFGLVDFVPCDCKKGEEYAARQCRVCGGHGVVNVRMDGSYIEEIGWCSCRAGDVKRDRDPSHVRRFNDEARTKKPAAMALLGRTTARAQTAAA